MSKLLLVAAGAAGYVLGARAGRERYEQIAQQAQKVWSNPKVQQTRQQATDAAMAQAPVVKEKLQDVTSTVTSKVSSSGGDHARTSAPTPVGDYSQTSATTPVGDYAQTSATTPVGDHAQTQEETPAAAKPVI